MKIGLFTEQNMHGLISLLPSPHYEQVENIWKELEEECGLIGIRVTPYPHFSWQIASDYDFVRLEQTLRNIAANARPFVVRTTGLGIFTGPRPVIFIKLVKSLDLMNFHAMVWEQILPVGKEVSSYYSPEVWVPHISLAYEDVDRQNIASVMAKLAFRPFAWEMTIDNITLIYEPGGETGALRYHYTFAGPAGEEIAGHP